MLGINVDISKSELVLRRFLEKRRFLKCDTTWNGNAERLTGEVQIVRSCGRRSLPKDWKCSRAREISKMSIQHKFLKLSPPCRVRTGTLQRSPHAGSLRETHQ